MGGGGRDAETSSRQPAASQRAEKLSWWLCNSYIKIIAILNDEWPIDLASWRQGTYCIVLRAIFTEKGFSVLRESAFGYSEGRILRCAFISDRHKDQMSLFFFYVPDT